MSTEIIARDESTTPVVAPIFLIPEKMMLFSLNQEQSDQPWLLDTVRELDEIEFQPRWWPGVAGDEQ